MTLNDQERDLSSRLHSAADHLEVPADLLLRVRASAEQPRSRGAGAGRRAKWLMPGLAAAAVAAGCVLVAITPRNNTAVPAVVHPDGANSAPASTTPASAPDRRTPLAVVTGYLTMARAGKCAEAAAIYWAPPTWNGPRGDLCEDTISEFGVSEHEVPSATAKSDVVAATLTTEGSADATVPAGTIAWFFQLERAPDGNWRITEGGSGP